MGLLALKLILTPSLLMGLALIQRRFGHRIAGMFTGLPLNIGPILIFLAVEQGPDYVRASTPDMAMGVLAGMMFCIAYLEASKRVNWVGSLAAALAAYALVGFVLNELTLPLPLKFLCGLFAPLLVLFYLRQHKDHVGEEPEKQVNIIWRAVAAVAFVLLVTLLAHIAPPPLVSLLAIAPLFTSIMLAFTQHEYGHYPLPTLVFGLLSGSYGCQGLLIVLTFAPASWNYALIFTLGIVAALIVAYVSQQAITWWRKRYLD